MSKIRVVLVGGGTGGHFYPLISVAEALNRSEVQPSLYYMGPTPYDQDSLARNNITFLYCPAGKRRRYFSFLNFTDFGKTIFGIIVAILKLFYVYPDVVVSKGGYTSVPVVVAAWLLNIPIIVHESDAVPGSANKLGARFARKIFISYPETAQFFKSDRTSFIGIPIRSELRAPASPNPHERLGIDATLPVILVLGGSQGAEHLNELVLDALDEILTDFSIIHQTGPKHFNVISGSAQQLIPDASLFKRYHPVPFMQPEVLNDALHVATLVISRAGSGTIHEIALHGKPVILIPIPESVSHDQRTNAFTYARSGGAVVIEESNFSDGLLRAEIDRIMENSGTYDEMAGAALTFAKNNAESLMATAILEIGTNH